MLKMSSNSLNDDNNNNEQQQTAQQIPNGIQSPNNNININININHNININNNINSPNNNTTNSTRSNRGPLLSTMSSSFKPRYLHFKKFIMHIVCISSMIAMLLVFYILAGYMILWWNFSTRLVLYEVSIPLAFYCQAVGTYAAMQESISHMIAHFFMCCLALGGLALDSRNLGYYQAALSCGAFYVSGLVSVLLIRDFYLMKKHIRKPELEVNHV